VTIVLLLLAELEVEVVVVVVVDAPEGTPLRIVLFIVSAT
jgi:hypothetical protein